VILGAFERMVAFRYLRARRQERFVSVIAIFSLLGIALGVATLIIVMSVMNGFRAALLSSILGLNGDLGVYAAKGPLADFNQLAQRVEKVPGVTGAVPVVERGFADHHRFTARDIGWLRRTAHGQRAQLVTTAKDFVRLPAELRAEVEVLEVALHDDPHRFDR
jgi:hypothetical protein